MSVKPWLVAACIASLVPMAYAEDAHHPDETKKPAATKPAPKTAAKPAAAMDMDKMQEQMKRMQEQMAKMRATTDPKERQRLMAEHMKSMGEGMGMMRGMMGGASGGGMGMGSGQRMDMMEKRMDMMQMMMQQMMEHEQAGQAPAK